MQHYVIAKYKLFIKKGAEIRIFRPFFDIFLGKINTF